MRHYSSSCLITHRSKSVGMTLPNKKTNPSRVCATSLNPVDYRVAAQRYKAWHYPHILGVDVAGVIETIGENVVSWNP
jgi:NADPH:quinone reductase